MTSAERTRGISTSSPLPSLPSISCEHLPLDKPNKKPQSKSSGSQSGDEKYWGVQRGTGTRELVLCGPRAQPSYIFNFLQQHVILFGVWTHLHSKRVASAGYEECVGSLGRGCHFMQTYRLNCVLTPHSIFLPFFNLLWPALHFMELF